MCQLEKINGFMNLRNKSMISECLSRIILEELRNNWMFYVLIKERYIKRVEVGKEHRF